MTELSVSSTAGWVDPVRAMLTRAAACRPRLRRLPSARSACSGDRSAQKVACADAVTLTHTPPASLPDCGGTGCVLTSYSLFVPLCCTPLRAADSHRPAEWVNLKGDMRMVTVDGEKGTLACFGAVRENSTTCCYCERAGS